MENGTPGWEAKAREAGWLPPAEVELRVWRARNMNGDSCRWCGARRHWGTEGRGRWKRDPAPEPHRPGCRFYDGLVTHDFKAGHFGSFDYWINCTCGASYPEHDAEGNKQDCPDRELVRRQPKQPDLMAAVLAAADPGARP